MMSYEYRYHAWLIECGEIIKKERERRRKRNIAIVGLIANITPIIKKANHYGLRYSLSSVLSVGEETFRTYLRMTKSQFQELLELVGPLIVKSNAASESITTPARLAMTLRYLATGKCLNSLAYHHYVDVTTITAIIEETCKAIWNCLHEEVLAHPQKPQQWLDIAADFEEHWDFHHCIGAIDGKHVLIQSPDESVATNDNYKKNLNIVMLGICDANYMFTFIDIGAYPRRSGGGIFRNSSIGMKFNEKKMNLPEPKKLIVDGDPLPYVLVGDAAFQLSDYLLRPYSKKGAFNEDRDIFNRRLSRARKAIENTFGVLITQWRILKKPIEATVDNTMTIVKAIVCLHNWLRAQDMDRNEYIPKNIVDQFGRNGFIPARWRAEIENSAFEEISTCGPNNCSRSAMTIRDEFCDYFSGEGAVLWQYNCERIRDNFRV